MSANPAVSLFAEVMLKTDKAISAAKALPGQLKQAVANAKVELPVSITIPNDIAQQLNAKLAAIKLQPINVPINFVPAGMPGVSVGGGGSAVPMGGPGWALNGTGGGGAGGGSVGYRNPFSLFGLARAVGSGAAVYAAYAGLQLSEQMIDASNVQNNPQRILREWDSLGNPRNVMGDNFLRSQAGSLASLEAKERRQKAIEGIPLIGAGSRFVASLTDFEGGIGDQKYRLNRDREIYERSLDSQDAAGIRRAAVSRDPFAVHDAIAARQSRLDTKALGEAQSPETMTVAATALVANAVTAAAERVRVGEGVHQDIRTIQAGSAQFGYEATIAGQTMSGDTRGALLSRQEADRRRTSDDFEKRFSTASPQEYGYLKLEQSEAERAQKAKQAEELDKFDRQREKQASDSAARIVSIEHHADDRILAAKGQHFDAIMAASKHATDDRVSQLEREAKAEVDTTRKAQLHAQAIAEQAAGAKELAAIRIAANREDDYQLDAQRGGTDVIRLQAQGRGSEARKRALESDYDLRRQKIIDAGGDRMGEKLRALDDEYFARHAELQRGNDLTDEQRQLRTLEANGEVTGDRLTPRLEELRTRIRHEQEDAGNDAVRVDIIRKQGQADLRLLRRQLMPNVTYQNGEQFGHDLGNAIGVSMFNKDAEALFKKTEQQLQGGRVTDTLPQSSAKLGVAAEHLENASKELGKNKLVVLSN